jgi:transcriptional regulator with XRE-family HTH domain
MVFPVVEITAAQCRMARAALRIGVRELAESAGVSTNTITRFEQDEPLRGRTVDAIRAALEASGVAFVARNSAGGPGVRLAGWYSEVLEPALKAGFKPPRIVNSSDQFVRLVASDGVMPMYIDVESATFDARIGRVLSNDVRQTIASQNLAEITKVISQKFLEKAYKIDEVDGEKRINILIRKSDLDDIDLTFSFFGDHDLPES